MAGTPVRIFLMRHGETEWNVDGRWQGQSDSTLTPRGWQQARALAEALSAEPLVAVYSSELGRALFTAQEVAQSHGISVTVDSRLREIDTGLWTGRLGRDLRVEYPEDMDAWSNRPWAHRMPEGESLEEAQQRALSFFQEVMPGHEGQSVAVISHGALTQSILVHAMGRPLTDMWLKERVENCQISRLEWTHIDGLRLIDLADMRHLATVGTLGGWRTDPQPDDDLQEQG
jgi:broad specificity phosphatase PhoE